MWLGGVDEELVSHLVSLSQELDAYKEILERQART